MRSILPAAVLLAGAAVAWGAESHEVEVGAESLYYRTAASPLNDQNLLGLSPAEDLLRGTLHLKETVADARLVFSGYAERTLGGNGATRGVVRQAYLQYSFGAGLSLRVGKQRIAWGSGFAWNPTNRVEPPKNPLNTGLEQEGSPAARMDWIPVPWAGVILVAAQSRTTLGDLPFAVPSTRSRTAAVRARFLVRNTDLAVVASGGQGSRSLWGLDVGRALGGVTAHVEGALYRGSEIAPARDGETFGRVAAGLLYSRDTTSWSVEYFRNGEGYGGAAFDGYLARLGASAAERRNPLLPPPARAAALQAYLAGAAVPYSGGLGLRRHYAQGSWTRTEIGGKWTASARAVAGISDGGVAVTPGVAFAPRGDLTLNLDAILLLGPERSEYRLAPVRGALQGRVRVLF